LNAIALAGRWYTWFVGQHESDPGPAKRWREMSDHFVWNVIYPEASSLSQFELDWLRDAIGA
jgi:hypothetical protein